MFRNGKWQKYTNSFHVLFLLQSDKRSPFSSSYWRSDFSSLLHNKVLKSSVIILTQSRDRIDDTQILFSSFLSSEEMSKQQLLLLLCLLWDFKCSLSALVTVNKCFCTQMIKTNSFQSHQRPGEQRWIQSQATASVKCLTDNVKTSCIFVNLMGTVLSEIEDLLHCDRLTYTWTHCFKSHLGMLLYLIQTKVTIIMSMLMLKMKLMIKWSMINSKIVALCIYYKTETIQKQTETREIRSNMNVQTQWVLRHYLTDLAQQEKVTKTERMCSMLAATFKHYFLNRGEVVKEYNFWSK